MIIYRPHREGLRESLAEAKEFETEKEMKNYIVKQYQRFGVDDIVIDYENKTDDERCGWRDTTYVCVKRFGDEDYMELYGCPQCIGMCATQYDKYR